MYRSTHRILPGLAFVLLCGLILPVKNSPQSGIRIEVQDVKDRVGRLEGKLDDIPSQLSKLVQRMDDSDKREKEWHDWTLGICGAVLAGLLTMVIEKRFRMKP